MSEVKSPAYAGGVAVAIRHVEVSAAAPYYVTVYGIATPNADIRVVILDAMKPGSPPIWLPVPIKPDDTGAWMTTRIPLPQPATTDRYGVIATAYYNNYADADCEKFEVSAP